MPTYEYECKSCGHNFDLFQSMKDSSKRKCPKCKKMTLRRLIGPGAGIIFKGSGFYETDYRSNDYKKKADAEKGAGKPSDNGKSKDGAPAKKTAKSDPIRKHPAAPAASAPQNPE